jgi:hypothetical protein
MSLLTCFLLGIALNALSNVPRTLWGGQSRAGYLVDTFRETLAIGEVASIVWLFHR